MTQAPSRPRTKTQTLIDLIAQAPDGMTCRELIDATGYKVSTVTSTLAHLLDDGRICTPVLKDRHARPYRLNNFTGRSRRMGRVYYIPGREPGGQGISRKVDSPRPRSSRGIASAAVETSAPVTWPTARMIIAENPDMKPRLVVQAPRIVTGLVEITSDYGRIGRFIWYNSRPAHVVKGPDLRVEPTTRFGDTFFDGRAESAWYSHLE